MAVIKGNSITITGTGASDHFELTPGLWVLSVHADSWGVAALENTEYGSSNWRATKDSAGAVSFTANEDVQVVGGRCYRLNVSAYSDDITFTKSPGAFSDY